MTFVSFANMSNWVLLSLQRWLARRLQKRMKAKPTVAVGGSVDMDPSGRKALSMNSLFVVRKSAMSRAKSSSLLRMENVKQSGDAEHRRKGNPQYGPATLRPGMAGKKPDAPSAIGSSNFSFKNSSSPPFKNFPSPPESMSSPGRQQQGRKDILAQQHNSATRHVGATSTDIGNAADRDAATHAVAYASWDVALSSTAGAGVDGNGRTPPVVGVVATRREGRNPEYIYPTPRGTAAKKPGAYNSAGAASSRRSSLNPSFSPLSAFAPLENRHSLDSIESLQSQSIRESRHAGAVDIGDAADKATANAAVTTANAANQAVAYAGLSWGVILGASSGGTVLPTRPS